MIRPNPNRDWLLAGAKEEANGFVGVGGLAARLQNLGEIVPSQNFISKRAFSKSGSLEKLSSTEREALEEL